MLTKKQLEILKLIDHMTRTSGIAPSFEEMKKALGVSSKSGIHRIVRALEERGFLRRMPNRARALEVIRIPGEDGAVVSPAVAQFGLSQDQAISLPLYGRIAAGLAIEAVRDDTETINVPQELVRRADKTHFALEVAGDSMIDAGINDGDIVVIQACDTAENGSIVVAVIDDDNVTLKYIKKETGDNISLIPANKNYPIQKYRPGRVKVQGKLVALMRKY